MNITNRKSRIDRCISITFDVIVQTLIVMLGVGVIIWSYRDPDMPKLLLLVQMLLGPWQMLSCLLSIITRRPLLKLKAIHFVSSLLYLLVLYAIIADWILPDLREKQIHLLAIIPAWLLGAFYYTLTWKWVLTPRKKSSSFLPNLSF